MIAATICLLIEPDSTISTISTVAAVGDAQAVDERALDLEPLEHLADLRPAAMDDDRVDADLLQQHDVLREELAERVVAHGVAAIFDDDGLAGIAPHIGQRLRQRARP